MQRILSFPNASLQSTAATAESMPPDNPNATRLHLELLTYVLIKSLTMMETSFTSIVRDMVSPHTHVSIDSFTILSAS
jgi:hypothetical protein